MNCPYCGTQNEPGFQFCKTCGAKLPASAPQPQYQAPRQPQYQAPQQPQYQAPQQPQYQAPQQPQYQAPQQPQYQAPQQPQYQAPQQPQFQAPRQPQYQAPVSVAPQQPKKDIVGELINKVKSFDYKALLKEPKKLAIPAAAVAAVLVLIILISIIGSAGGKAVTPKTSYYAVEVDDEYTLLRDGKIIEEGLEYVYMYTSSMDGSVAVYECDDELFVIRNGKSISITDEYDDLTLSVNGATLLVTDYDGVLTAYNTKNGDATEIAEDVEWFCVSPDGKTVAYLVYDDGDYIAFLYKGNKSIELGEDLIPIAVSNGAKVIYCIDDNKGSLCTVDTKGNTEKIAGDVYDDGFFMNEDHTQMIFQADGKWYATVKGGEKIKLTSSYYFDILTYDYSACFVDENIDMYTYPTNDLRNCFVIVDSDISWMDNKWELTKAAKDVDEAYVSADGKTLVYLKDNGKLQKVTSKKLDKPVDLAEDVWSFSTTSDCSSVYFINEDEELLFQKGTGKAKKIADDVEGCIVTTGDVCLFLSDDEELFSSKNGGKKALISDDFYNIDMSGTTIYLWTDYDGGDFTFSALTKGSKFKEIYTN